MTEKPLLEVQTMSKAKRSTGKTAAAQRARNLEQILRAIKKKGGRRA